MSFPKNHYPILQRLGHKGRGNLLVKFCRSKTLFDSERPRLFDTTSASHVVVKDTFERRNKDHLHWHITANVSASDIPFAIVRNRLKRRYVSAFCSALKEKGYQTNGKVLPRSETDLDEKSMPQRGLQGTLEVFIFHKVANEVSFERMRQDAKFVIDAVRLQQAPVLSLPEVSAQDQAQLQPQLRPQSQPWAQVQTPIHQTAFKLGEMLLSQGKKKKAGNFVKRLQLA